MVDTIDRQNGVRRRTLVRTAAWSVPAIAVAAPAPAFAASCNQLYYGTFNWATNYTRASTSAGSGTLTFSNGRTSTVTLSSTFTNYTATANNLTVTNPVGGTGAAGLTLFHQPDGNGTILNPYRSGSRANNQILTITFGTPVYNLSMLLTDIDSTTGDFIDAVEVSGSTYSSSTASADVGGTSTVSGAGTQASPFLQTNANAPSDNGTGTGGNVRLTFPGAVTSISFRYWNNIAPGSITATPDQAMFISNMQAGVYNAGC